jgi:hypothetical protein
MACPWLMLTVYYCSIQAFVALFVHLASVAAFYAYSTYDHDFLPGFPSIALIVFGCFLGSSVSIPVALATLCLRGLRKRTTPAPPESRSL